MLRDDRGFTLAEVLIALVLTALVAISVGAVVSYASKSLWKSTNTALVTQQALRTSASLRNDFAGSGGAFIYGETLPPAGTRIATISCSSDSSGSKWPSSATWLTSSSLVRTLFTLEYVELTTDPTSSWMKPTKQLVSYEVRRNSASNPFELWRVLCDPATYPAIKSQERLISLGDSSNFPASSTSGTSNLTCNFFGGNSGCTTLSSFTPIVGETNEATAARMLNKADFFSFKLPYPSTGSSSSLRRLIADLQNKYLGTLKMRVEGSL